MADFAKVWACNIFLKRMSTESTKTFKMLTECFG